MNRLLPFIASILLVGGCTNQSGNINQPLAMVTGERLLASPPEGWEKVFQVSSENTRLADFIPPGEDRVGWSTKVSFESHTTEELTLDPIELLFSEAETDQSRCNFVQHFNIFSGFENNYPTSVRLFLCGENAFTSRGEIKLIKAIKGIDFLYSVRIVRRIRPFELSEQEITHEEVAFWSSYLSKISACDDSPEHPCPEVEPTTAGTKGQ